jgi:hypothetical protein
MLISAAEVQVQASIAGALGRRGGKKNYAELSGGSHR